MGNHRIIPIVVRGIAFKLIAPNEFYIVRQIIPKEEKDELHLQIHVRGLGIHKVTFSLPEVAHIEDLQSSAPWNEHCYFYFESEDIKNEQLKLAFHSESVGTC